MAELLLTAGSTVSWAREISIRLRCMRLTAGEGIAARLLQDFMQESEKRGIHSFTLEVRVSNTAAIRLYESCGFQIEGTRKGFYDKPKRRCVYHVETLANANNNYRWLFFFVQDKMKKTEEILEGTKNEDIR